MLRSRIKDLSNNKQFYKKIKNRNRNVSSILFNVAFVTLIAVSVLYNLLDARQLNVIYTTYGNKQTTTIITNKTDTEQEIEETDNQDVTVTNYADHQPLTLTLTEIKDTNFQPIINTEYADHQHAISPEDDHQSVINTEDAHHQPAISIEYAVDNIAKPKLILHVGPLKSATTTIQSILKDRDMRSALLKDKYHVVNFGVEKLKRVLKDCFVKLPKESDCRLWHALVKSFDTAREANNSVIFSNEILSRLPINNMTLSLWKNLLVRWDIKVFIVHRPFDQWIQSLYVQYRKNTMYQSGLGRFRQDFLYSEREDKEKIFPDWFQWHLDSNFGTYNDTIFGTFRDTIATKIYYDNLFGSNRVYILDMLASDGVEVEFFCNANINAVHGCESFRKKGKKIIENSSEFISYKLDTDLIITEAHRQNLGDLDSHRVKARDKLETKLIEWNMTSSDLPKACVSQEQESWMWNRTVYSNKMFSFNPLPEKKLQAEFAINKKKFCSVDAYAVLKNSTWREYLLSFKFKNK